MRRLSRPSLYRTFVLMAAFVFFSIPVSADTVYFKDGRVWTGLIQGEDAERIELDLGFDTARLEKDKIARIRRSGGKESNALRKELDQRKRDAVKKLASRGSMPKTVRLYEDGNGHWFVKARLNGRYDAELLLDTGASTVVLSKALAKKMGLKKTPSSEIVELKVADGRTSEGVYTLLPEVEVEGARATKVPAVFATGNFKDVYFRDGLLGMSD